MPYQPPSLEVLYLSISQLRTHYEKIKQDKKTVPNDARLKSITLIERLAHYFYESNHPKKTEYIIGLLLFVLLKIENKYGKLSNWLPYDQGELGKLIRSTLGMTTQNVMTQQERLIYLAHFHEAATDMLQDAWVADLPYQNKKYFMQSIDIKIKQTIAMQQDYIEYILKTAPDYVSLERNIDDAITKYEAIFNGRWLNQISYFRNESKQSAIHLLKLIQQACKEWMKPILSNAQLDANFIAIQKEYIYEVRQGLILSILLPYQAHHLPPKGSLINHGSELYQRLFAALNKELKDFDHAERIRLLKRLLDFIEKAKIDFSMYNDLKRQAIFDTINYLLASEEIAKTIPSFTERYTGAALGYLTQYGIGILATELTADLVLPHVGHMVVGSVAGPLGIVSFGVAGAIVESQLGQLVQEQVIDRATALVYEYILSAIGVYIGQLAAPNIILTFETGAGSIGKLLGFYHDLTQFDKGFTQKVEWINVLHQLPSHLVNDHKKQILEKTQGAVLKYT